jgi:hypothetical protein
MSDATQITPAARKSLSDRFWNVITSATFVGLIVFAFSLAGIGALIYAVVKTLGPSSASFGLPILALLSVLLLLGALLIFTTLIHTIGLSDKGSALGLPEGSVRALLALALLGLFAVLAASVLVNPPTPVDEFGKQMLTLVGTLMTAVISFYFGSATGTVATTQTGTTSGAGAVASGVSETTATGIAPTRAKKATSQTYSISGKGLANVTKVEALAPGGGSPMPATNLNATDTAVTFDFSFPGAGRWTVQITAGGSAPIPVPGVIEVTDS